jgi:GrpB-like predicted nucleotidyltransferase (UPF0157 family)
MELTNGKELYDMTLAELWELFPIVLKEHNPDYADWYEVERGNLLRILAAQVVYRINHIGSTAVPELIAKPTVDILLEMDGDYDTAAIGGILEERGWLVMARDSAAKTIDLNKGYTKTGFADKVFHLHIKPKGDHGELYFRDYLRGHDDVARDYEQLKRELKERYEHDRDGYTDAKTDFIKKYTALARQEFGGRYANE